MKARASEQVKKTGVIISDCGFLPPGCSDYYRLREGDGMIEIRFYMDAFKEE